MRKSLIYILLIFNSFVAKADLLNDILSHKYDAKVLSDVQIDSLLNPTEQGRYRLEYENKQQVYRRSFVADYYLVDTIRKTRTKFSDMPIRDPKISPNGKYIVYGKGKDLYIYKIDFKTEIAITQTDSSLAIYNGITDWLYEEEFSATSVFAFSPDSKLLAFVRFDDTQVPAYYWTSYLQQKDSTTWSPYVYPKIDSVIYPKVGGNNPKVSVCVYDIYYKTILTMQTAENVGGYIPRIAWRTVPSIKKDKKDENEQVLAIASLNRDQNKFTVQMANPYSSVCKTWYTEENKNGWIDYGQFDDWQWLSDGTAIVVNSKNGWRQAYLYNINGQEMKRLTKNNMNVLSVYGYDEKEKILYYLTTDGNLNRQGFALNTKKKNLTPLANKHGWHSFVFSNDLQRYIDCYQTDTTPTKYTLYDVKSKKNHVVLANDSVKKEWQKLALPRKEFFTIDSVHAWILKPTKQETKYPVVFMQYSGPGSQLVKNTWKKGWEYALVEAGYVVVGVDVAEIATQSNVWREKHYMKLGSVETQNLLSAVSSITAKYDFIDADRMAIWGWSYGGYMVLRTLCEKNHPFKCGIAIAPITDMRLYDSGYTERFMRRLQVNDRGYKTSDLLTKASNLKGKLLLVHGLADDNVHVQNSWLFVEELVRAGIIFEMQMYPDDDHFLKKRSNYEHVHRTFMDFLDRNLN